MTNKYKSSATIIPIQEAVGKVLAHDITEIRPGDFKGPAFKKGRVIEEKDLDHLRRLGKEHLYVLHLSEGEVHEDDAALRLSRAFAGPGVVFDPNPSEGKISFKSEHRGILKVDVEALTKVNMVPDISCSSRHNNSLVDEGETVAATRAIPLIIDEALLNEAVIIAEEAGRLFSVKALSQPSAGLVVSGNEVHSGLIEDKFTPIIRKKLGALGCKLKSPLFTPDIIGEISSAIHSLIQEGAEIIFVGGGMSVDPDDVSRLAIAEAGAEDIVYGTPVLPGAMFLYGRIGEVPVLGLPACILFFKATVLDILLPRVLSGEKITRQALAELAHGGLCLGCRQCRYPICPFGK